MYEKPFLFKEYSLEDWAGLPNQARGPVGPSDWLKVVKLTQVWGEGMRVTKNYLKNYYIFWRARLILP